MILHLTANFSRGEAVGVDIPVDGIASYGLEKGIEAVLARREPLTGKR